MRQFLDIELPPGGARRYEIVIGLQLPDEAAADLAAHAGPRRWAVISDDTVGPLYAEPLAAALREQGSAADVATFATGERYKTRETVARLQDELIELGLGRDSWVAAVGGGVVGDVAGFVAATLFRGIPYVQLPTSLLAMVDSSVGGKTGVDTPAGKNLVGAFLQPRRVLIDVATLETLPRAELAAGFAEIIKYGVILDADLFERLESGLVDDAMGGSAAAVQSLVFHCCDLKAAVVAQDETESDYRQILNFGHTVAHAIEAVMGFGVRHGEAVAMGMVAEARLAEEMLDAPSGLADRIAALCARAELPTALPEGCDPDAVLAAAFRDKKSRSGAIRCALPARLGLMHRSEEGYGAPVAPDRLRAVIG